jgi:beta-glucosidase
LTSVTRSEDAELLDRGFGELYPEGLARAVKRLARLKLPIHVTENGIPDEDDDQRPRALLLHLHQLWRVIQENTRVKSYYHWTLVDNFEWAEGWTMPFGLIALDPETQARTPRPSADLYAAVARGNAITPELLHAYAPELRPVLLPG